MRRLTRSTASVFGTALVAAGLLAGPATAQTWPSQPVKFMVGTPPGGLTDILARSLQEPLSKGLGQPVIVENKPGASGMIAAEQLAKAPKDGHTISMMFSSWSSMPAMGAKLNFDPGKDLAPVALIGQIPLLIAAHPSLPAKTLKELVDYAKANPGKLSYGTPGVGLAQHFSGELLKQKAGIDMVHVPYKGAAPVNQDLVGGQILVGIISPASALSLIEAGRIRPIAVTGAARVPSLPDVPTVAESGYPDYDVTEWYGIAAPAGVDPAVIARLNKEIVAYFSTDDRQAWRKTVTMQGGLGDPASFATFLKADMKLRSDIAAAAKITLD